MICSYSLFAQNKETITKEPKFKPPVVKTYLGVNQNGAEVTLDEGTQLVGLPLKITDEKNNQYPVVSYQFLYRKRGVTENEETGKVTPITSIVSNRFKVTPLPDTWASQVKEQVKPGEELFFFDVIAKDAQGRIMYAPNLKIMVR